MWVSTWLLDKWNFDLQICIQAPASVAARPGQQLFATADVCSSHNTLWEETAAICLNSQFKRSPGGFCRESELILEIHNTTSSPSCICQVFDGKEVGKNARNASSGRAAFPHLLMLPSAPWHWVALSHIHVFFIYNNFRLRSFIGMSRSVLATSYVKCIDVWMIFTMIVPFLQVRKRKIITSLHYSQVKILKNW